MEKPALAGRVSRQAVPDKESLQLLGSSPGEQSLVVTVVDDVGSCLLGAQWKLREEDCLAREGPLDSFSSVVGEDLQMAQAGHQLS
jgi:hypothetical protein